MTKYAPHAHDSRNRALNWVGSKYPAGWCLKFQVSQIFAVPGVGDWDRDGDADAVDYWKAAIARGKVVKTSTPSKIPAGALIFWTGGAHGYGHAAYSLGDGQMVSTDLPTTGKVGKVAVDLARTKWGLKLVGYVVTDANGYTLARPASKPAGANYKVSTPKGLNGRLGPSLRSQSVYIAAYGEGLKIAKTVTGDGYEWAVTCKGIHYVKKYLTKL